MRSPLSAILDSPLFSPLRVALWSILTRTLARKNLAIVTVDHNDPQRAEAYQLIRQVRQETALIQTEPEAYAIYSAAARTAKVPGDLAELGVFRGGSARLICGAKGARPLHLFDTFAGLPDPGPTDAKFRRGGFTASLAEVERYLAPFPNVVFHPGQFPKSARELDALTFSFVHLDVDLYESTLNGLRWFYPRLNRGGMLIAHDYTNTEGVRRAFDEFFADKPECLIEMAGTQVAFVKI